jgi:branched-chain amino acid transport system ATP-binding protein
LRAITFSPFGYALRALRDSTLRADTIGIVRWRVQWMGFVIAGAFAALAGAHHAFLKGSVFPDNISISPSIDGFVMVLLGGVGTVSGGVVGAAIYRSLSIWVISHTDYSKLVLGALIILLVVLFPKGLVGQFEAWRSARAISPHRRKLMSILVAEKLGKSYSGFEAVREVSFALEAGEILALIGPNGAGKSTCFAMIDGQLAPTTGRIMIFGRSTTGMAPGDIWRLGVGRTFQVVATFASMTVAENVQMAMLSCHSRRWPALRWAARYHVVEAERLLDLIGMTDQAQRSCGELAYGDLKRLEFAVALANNPKLLLMDEPAAGMAPRERHALMSLTARIARERTIGVLFTEHDMDVVFGHADRVLVLNRGTLIAEGAPAAVRANAEVQAVYLGAGSLYGASH